MNIILPIHEIQEAVAAGIEERMPRLVPEHDAGRFSLEMASGLMELCLAAERGSDVIRIEHEGDDVFAALRSIGDPADLLNVRGRTDVRPVAFGTGNAYGPLVNAYRDRVASNGLSELAAGKRVWLSGHGIGAAYALFAALDLTARGQTVAAVYTFGAPRVGDRAFVRGFSCPVFRVVNNLDVMVTMPTPWKWRHVGEYKLINADGSLNARPNSLNRMPSLSRQTAWLGELLRDGLASGFPRSLYRLLRQVLGDHAPESYVRRLRELL